MSDSVAYVDEGGVACAERAKSLDVISLNDNDLEYTLNSDGTVQDDSGSGRFRVGRLLLPNGDSYSGSLLGNIPEGRGRYVWSDSCIYEGEWRQGVRHGNGKLLWPSGAVYEGEFSGGYIHGTGTYVRRDNLTYRGRWRMNLKHGLGYQIYPNGDVFEGSWIQGLPEGPGKYSWSNGNVYLGNMKIGKMSGKGTLNWTNGDFYEGNWLNGMMHGFGVHTWSDGGCYVGTWTWGLKDGKGSFYPRGNHLPAVQDLYLSALRKRGLLPDMRKQKQNHLDIHHSATVDMGSVKVYGNGGSQCDQSDRFSNVNFLNLEQSCNRNVSLERRWSLEASIENIIGHGSSSMSSQSLIEGKDKESNTNIPILEREYMQGVLISEIVIDNRFSVRSRRTQRRQTKLAKEIKMPGEAIIKGHRSYDLMLSLQLGIRYTVGKITPIQRREVRVSDFGHRATFWMNFPAKGSLLTPPHLSEDFKWKDYCPMVFRDLREMFKIDAADYMMSICGNDALRELSSPGKSGSVFFLSQDDRFMIKTLRKSEVKVLLRMLPDYHHHVKTYENTLITKFFGLHRIIPSSGQMFCFVVMGNMFCTELRIHRRFDLKGSSLGRSADNVEIDENTVLKDLDLNYSFFFGAFLANGFIEVFKILSFVSRVFGGDVLRLFSSALGQIEIDSKFLESKHIMDYSLLLGVHYRAPQHLRSLMSCTETRKDGLEVLTEEDPLVDYPQGLILVPSGTHDSIAAGAHIRGRRLRASAAGDEEVDLLLPGTARLQIQLGVNMPARAEQIPGKEDKQLVHGVYDVVLYLGIIDILQDYNMAKKIEHAYKSLQFDSLSISVVDPTFYSTRFLEFVQKVFPANEITR